MKGIITLVLFILWLISATFVLPMRFAIDRDINGWLDMAQVASDPVTMGEDLQRAHDGMVRYGLTEGNAALVWRTPETEMPLIMKALDASIQRTKYMANFTTDSIQYQVSLDDLRGQIRELNLHATDRYFVDTPHRLLAAYWILLGWLILIAVGFYEAIL